MLCDASGQRRGVRRSPAEMFGKNFLRIQIRQIVQAKEEMAVGIGMVGVQLHRTTACFDRFLVAALVQQRVAQIVQCIRVIRPEPQGFAIGGNRLIKLTQIRQRAAEVDAGLRAIRLDLQPPAKGGDGIVQLPAVVIHIAQIVVSVGIVWTELQRLMKGRNGFIRTPHLPIDLAEIGIKHRSGRLQRDSLEYDLHGDLILP